ncbi:hypothetical protein ABW20_dc0101043 [Dactylellina cionopaga]|nr:hypothetical protein ABW20_dc0101043 [Dactylellina cionopaga]
MYNLKVFATAALGLFSATSFAQLTSSQVVTDINILTAVSNTALTQLNTLSRNSAAPQVNTVANNLVTSLNNIINDLSADTPTISSTSPFSDADAAPVLVAFNSFVEKHSQLLAAINIKHKIFAQFLRTPPIAASLRSLEGALDSFGLSLVNLLPTKAAEVTVGNNQLQGLVGNDIDTYQQTCVPSPLYPTVQPICTSL